jgi:hypothetical protein
VVFEAGLDLPPPTAGIAKFQPEWVAEPPMSGRAWVRLMGCEGAPRRMVTRLPDGKFLLEVPIDFVRTLD